MHSRISIPGRLQLCKCPRCRFGQLANAHLVPVTFQACGSSEAEHAKRTKLALSCLGGSHSRNDLNGTEGV